MMSNTTLAEIIDNIEEELDVGTMEAVLVFAERHDIEPETIGEWIKRDPVLKGKIETEASSLSLLKGGRPHPLPFG